MSESKNLRNHHQAPSVWDQPGLDGTKEPKSVAQAVGEAVKAVAGRAAEVIERAGLRRPDAVHEASDESFPASDAPSWTPTVAAGAGHSKK